MRVGSLFSGIGLGDLGMMLAGHERICWDEPSPEPTIRGVDAKGARCVERLKALGNGIDVRSAHEVGRLIGEYEEII